MICLNSHQGAVQLKLNSRLPGRHSKAHFSYKDGETRMYTSQRCNNTSKIFFEKYFVLLSFYPFVLSSFYLFAFCPFSLFVLLSFCLFVLVSFYPFDFLSFCSLSFCLFVFSSFCPGAKNMGHGAKNVRHGTKKLAVWFLECAALS